MDNDTVEYVVTAEGSVLLELPGLKISTNGSISPTIVGAVMVKYHFKKLSTVKMSF